MRSIFGWSYPPGCSGPPDEEGPCYLCGQDVDHCICPECPVCGAVGDHLCYLDHGLHRTEEQKFSLEVAERQWAEDNRIENEMWDQLYEEFKQGEMLDQ